MAWSKKDVKKAVADVVSDETLRVMDELRREEDQKLRELLEAERKLEASRVSLIKKSKEPEPEPEPKIVPLEDTFYCLIEGSKNEWLLTIKSDDERATKQKHDGTYYIGSYEYTHSYKTVSCVPDWGEHTKTVSEDKALPWVRNEAAKFLAIYVRSYNRCHTIDIIDQDNARVKIIFSITRIMVIFYLLKTKNNIFF